MFKLVKPDKKKIFEKIKIDYTKNIPPVLIQKLYLSVGWQYRNIQDINISLVKSMLIVTAWDEEILVGIARATGDGIFNATIWDVAVKPAYQKHGIGSLIMKSMLTKLDDYGIPLITLYTEFSKKDFYSKLGFETNIKKIISMYRFNDHSKDKEKQEK